MACQMAWLWLRSWLICGLVILHVDLLDRAPLREVRCDGFLTEKWQRHGILKLEGSAYHNIKYVFLMEIVKSIIIAL